MLAGAGAAAVLGCAGVGTPSGSPPAPVGSTGEPGTLHLPSRNAADRKVAGLIDAPAWFRTAGGVYCPSPRSAGSALLMFAGSAEWALPRWIDHYRELPKLLVEARRLGTDILYLVDWYEPLDGDPPEEGVWNKGDYLPRSAMGGDPALRDGIRAVHDAGGRVVLYVEPFVMRKTSRIGRSNGERWSIRTADGIPNEPYPDAWKICPANPEVVAYFASVADRVVGDYGADGLFLDSYGNQRGWRCVERSHGHAPGQGDVFNEGCRILVARMLEVARAARSDAILLCEGPEISTLFRSVSASQDWGIHSLVTRWIWNRPGRVTSAGWGLDDLHQIVALGHKLALGAHFWLDPPPERSAVAWMDRLLPDRVPDKKDRRFRRFYAEDVFRGLHQWRNAAILLGRGVPNIDAATPRRWDRDEEFESYEGMLGILDECRIAARRLDEALAGAAELPAPTEHVRRLGGAAAGLARITPGTQPERVQTGVPYAVAWRFAGTAGEALTVANVGDTGTVELPNGSWRELVTGTEIAARGGPLPVEAPAHSVRVYLRT